MDTPSASNLFRRTAIDRVIIRRKFVISCCNFFFFFFLSFKESRFHIGTTIWDLRSEGFSCLKYSSDSFILFTSLSCLWTGVYCSSDRFITRHSQVWHWYIQRSPLLKTRWWNSWCLQDAAGLHWGQHLSLRLSGALQSHTGSLQVITPSWHVHLLQGFPDGAKVSPLLTSRFSNQQPKIIAPQCNNFFTFSIQFRTILFFNLD